MPSVSLGPAGTWPDSSVNGAWLSNFNGFGYNSSNGTTLNQRPQFNLAGTSACLVTTTASYSTATLIIDVDVVNNLQLHTLGGIVSPWEGPWLFWGHETVALGPNGIANAYYVTVGTNYVALGRVTNGTGTTAQCFLADGPALSATPVGTPIHLQVKQTGGLIEVRKNGTLVISYTDIGTSGCGAVKTTGKIGLYTEDADVTWSNLVVSDGSVAAAATFSGSTKTVSAASVVVGSPVTYTITVRNTGNAAGTATVSDTVPTGLTGITWSAPGASPSSGTGNVNTTTGLVAAGGNTVITVTGTTTTVGTIAANTAVVAGTSIASQTVAVTAVVPNWSGTKTHNIVGTARLGQLVTYTVKIRNGASAALSATLGDNMPYGLSDATWSAPAASPPSGTGSMNTVTPSILPGATYTATITAKINVLNQIQPNILLINGIQVASLPITVGAATLTISGSSPPNSLIRVFDGNTLLASELSSASGSHLLEVPVSANSLLVYCTPTSGLCVRLSPTPSDGLNVYVVPAGTQSAVVTWTSYPRVGCNC